MSDALINGSLRLTYPDGFHEMDGDELRRAFGDQTPDRWGIWDTDRHIIVSVAWHESNARLSRLASTKALAKRVQKHAAKTYAKQGYRAGGLFGIELCGAEAWGFDYRYDVGDIGQVGKALVLKHLEGSTCCCYTVYYHAREELAVASAEVLQAIMASMRIA